MKLAVAASAVCAALVSGSTLAATVYQADGTELKVGGRVEFRGDFIGNSKGEEIQGTMDDSTRARLNLKGKSEIADGMTAFAVYEAEQDTGKDEFENRYMFAGVDFDGHAVSFGRQDMAAVIVSDFTDVTEFSGIQQVINSASDKEDSVVAYRGAFDSFQLQATYQANSTEDSDGYGISGVYSAPSGLNLGLAFSGADLGKGLGSQSQILGGIGYTLDNLYLGATYSVGDLDDKATGASDKEFTALEVVAQYKFTKQLSAALLYTNQENEQADGTKYDDTDGVELVGYYKFNSHFRTYVSYFSNGVTSTDTNADGFKDTGEDTLRLGVRYDF
ncbi:porin [Vibrio brasiliensis]|uniref:porin n=1 Tax=Vibrio brasiliensis TaxID=170652 RepID=UPI001EFCD1A6|nr:porin [Vibrio brasiliensis]MCG9726745.1 porin [Vibrio brasiliensis]